jgi:hypothetical protein
MTLSAAETKVRRLALLQLQDSPATITRDAVVDAVDTMIAVQPAVDQPTIDRERLIREVETACNVWVEAPSAIEGDDDHVEWLSDKTADIEWKFWNRYRRWLEEEEDFPPAVVRRLHGVTNEILKRLEDPSRAGQWDRRGMVVGHVQSGKTANYTGLICKAADAGYKLIVVLAGVHNSLRSQTQLRLDEGFIGFDTQRRIDFNRDNTRMGAGAMLGADFPVVHPLTTSFEKGDFSKTVAQGVGVTIGGSDPVILVVKKHRSILENLTDWATANRAVVAHGETIRRVPDVPILVIDDECDHASVNTKDSFDSAGEYDPDLDPTAINGAIRKLLNSFNQSAYVGYTATPFANIFIYKDAEAGKYGEDLFPRSFIIGLKRSSQYVGADRVFGLTEDPSRGIAASEPLPILRDITDNEDWIPSGHKKHLQVPSELPDSLRSALLTFVLSCAARRARGDVNKHNSMLVHVTRFKDVQAQVRDAVAEELQYIKDQIEFAGGGTPPAVLAELESLWHDDFVPTTEEFRDESLPPIAWESVRSELHQAASRIELKVINGDASDALDYYDRRATGMSVIAIGGDKLSRGLTLEGLSVSYYLRASKMYDTLLQMGRWFGFRPGYGDLCRLYTTPELQRWYKDITVANEELFQQFEEMALLGGSPNDFGLRVANSADGLLITAATKLRNGTKLKLSFSGSISETIMFLKDGTTRANYEASERFINKISTGHLTDEGARGNHLFRNVPAEEIVSFLRSFTTHAGATKAQSQMLVTYIEGRIKAKPAELTEWTVALISNKSNKKPFAGLEVGLTERSPHNSDDATYAIRRLLSPPDEALDLSPEEYTRALEWTRQQATKNDSKGEPSGPGGQFVRRVRPVTRGLLLMYLLDPETGEMPSDDKTPAVVGIGLSFPRTDNSAAIEYTVNNTYWDEMLDR